MSAEPEGRGILDYIRRAFGHAEEAGRAYLALLAADVEKRYSRVLRRSIEMLALVGVGIIGLAILIAGFARFLEDQIGTPGSGQMLIGGFVVIVTVVGYLVIRGKEGK